jgi:hypothetical protein
MIARDYTPSHGKHRGFCFLALPKQNKVLGGLERYAASFGAA